MYTAIVLGVMISGCNLFISKTPTGQSVSLSDSPVNSTATQSSSLKPNLCTSGPNLYSQPSNHSGWCKMANNYFSDNIFFPENWTTDVVSPNFARIYFNSSENSSSKPKVVFINTSTELPLQETDQDGYYEMGNDELQKYVKSDEKILERKLEMIGNNKTLHLLTKSGSQMIDRYFLKSDENRGHGSLYIFEIYIDENDFINGHYETEPIIREMISLIEFRK